MLTMYFVLCLHNLILTSHEPGIAFWNYIPFFGIHFHKKTLFIAIFELYTVVCHHYRSQFIDYHVCRQELGTVYYNILDLIQEFKFVLKKSS